MVKLVEMREESVRKAYRRWAGSYDLTFGRIADAGRLAAVARLNLMPPGARILEAGVGTGISLSRYAPHLRVTGIDLSPEMLARARKRVQAGALSHVEGLQEMDAARLEFPDASFDAVAAMYLMTVVPDPRAVMAEMARVVRPGGEVVVLNHFTGEGGVRRAVEKGMAPFAEALGWRPDFPKAAVTGAAAAAGLRLEAEAGVKPLGLFTLLRFRRGIA